MKGGKKQYVDDLDSGSDFENEAKSRAIPEKIKKAKKPPPVAQSTNEEIKLVSYLPPLPDKGKVREGPMPELQNTNSFKDKPIQLVRINHDIGKFQVCEQGIRTLQGIEGNVGVVAFTGLYRTGKSFTLNLLLDKLGKGFEVDPTVNSCTQGLWIWGKPVYIKESNMHLIFIDTEGSGSTDRNNTHDAKIFALVVLLSSFLIYNRFALLHNL